MFKMAKVSVRLNASNYNYEDVVYHCDYKDVIREIIRLNSDKMMNWLSLMGIKVSKFNMKMRSTTVTIKMQFER